MKYYTLEEVKKAMQGCDTEWELIELYIQFGEKTEHFNKNDEKEMQQAYRKRLTQIQSYDV